LKKVPVRCTGAYRQKKALALGSIKPHWQKITIIKTYESSHKSDSASIFILKMLKNNGASVESLQQIVCATIVARSM